MYYIIIILDFLLLFDWYIHECMVALFYTLYVCKQVYDWVLTRSYVCECSRHTTIMGDNFHIFLLYAFCGLYSVIIILDFLLLFDPIFTCIIRLCACNLLCSCMCANRCMIELLLESMWECYTHNILSWETTFTFSLLSVFC